MSESTGVGASSTTHVVATTLENGYHVVATDDAEPIEYHWIAEVSELPGCMTCGRTADEAIAEARGLIDDFIRLLREDGCSVPAPNAHLGHDVWDHMTAYAPKLSELRQLGHFMEAPDENDEAT